MFTPGELEIIGKDEAGEAICKSVGDLLMDGGHANLADLSPQQIDLVIYMLRQFKAIFY